MPRQDLRKASRPPGGPPARRRPVAGTRGRRPTEPVETPEAVVAEDTVTIDLDLDAGTSVRSGATTAPSVKPQPRPSPRPAPARQPRTSEPKAQPRASWFAGVWVLPLLIVLSLAFGTVLGGTLLLTVQHKRTDSARTAALAAARSDAERILSYDYRHIDADIAGAKALMTGTIGKDYAKTSPVVKTTAVQIKAVVSAEVRAASVRSASPNRVVVLLFVNQTTTSTKVSGSKVDQSRVRMTLVKSGHKWLVSDIDAL